MMMIMTTMLPRPPPQVPKPTKIPPSLIFTFIRIVQNMLKGGFLPQSRQHDYPYRRYYPVP